MQGYTKIENKECERKVTRVCHETLHWHLCPVPYCKKNVVKKENTKMKKFPETESYLQ